MADSYSKWVMTNSFANNMQASINSGNKIEWVSIKTSDDTHLFADLAGFNDTTLATASIKQTATINTISINGNTVTITALFNNQDNQADYYIKTLFLVAKYNGTEFLAGATVANSASTAFRMPAASATEITEFTARPQITVSNSSTISATVDPVAAATNKRVDGLEATLQGEIDDINADKQSLWNTLVNYVTKAGTDTITGVKTFTQTIVGSITGNAGTATKLQTPRKLKVNLASTADQTFDGSADQVGIGVDGILPVKNGGSGASTRLSAFNNLAFFGVNPSFATNGTDNTLDTVANWKAAGTGYALFLTAGTTLSGYPTTSAGSNTVFITNYVYSGEVYQEALVYGGVKLTRTQKNWGVWTKLSDDSTVVHNTGDETISGTKTFASEPFIKGLQVSNGSNSTSLFKTNATIPNQTNSNMPIGLASGSTLVLGGGEAANSFLSAMADGAVPIGSADGANEQLVMAGDAAVYIGAGYQSGGTTGKWWAFNQNGTVTAPSGNLLQEVNTGSITIKGSGTWFATDSSLTLTYSGKIVSVQGELKTVADMSGGTSMSEILIPSGYRPVFMRTKQVGFNSSSASTKVFADVYFNPNGVISIDNVVVGANMTAWGTIPAGSSLNISDTWVIA